jgi:hypothetical protein
MFTAALFTIAKCGNSRGAQQSNQMDKENMDTHIVGNYSAIKNGMMSFAGK